MLSFAWKKLNKLLERKKFWNRYKMIVIVTKIIRNYSKKTPIFEDHSILRFTSF